MSEDNDKLRVSRSLESDLRGLTESEFVLLDFFCFVWGTEDGRPPRFSEGAQTVWRIEGDGNPPPEINQVDWGSEHLGLPELRLWFVRAGQGQPIGVGLIEVKPGAQYPEQQAILERIRELFGAGCWLQKV